MKVRSKNVSEIKGFEKCTKYIVYEDGRVYSLHRNAFLKGSTDSSGYNYMDFRSCNPVIRNPKTHRLVMLAFSTDKPKEQINHKDGDKSNNHINNLEWATNRENREHAIETGLKDEIKYGIAQYDLEGNLLNVFDTAKEALIHLGKDPNQSGNIGRAIRGKRKTSYGFIWKQY